MAGKGPFEELREDVDANGGVVFRHVADLRDAVGKARVGKWVSEEIQRELRRRGMDSTDISVTNAWAGVLVFAQGGEVERMVKAVIDPSEHSAQTLRGFASGGDADKVRQIRLILEEE